MEFTFLLCVLFVLFPVTICENVTYSDDWKNSTSIVTLKANDVFGNKTAVHSTEPVKTATPASRRTCTLTPEVNDIRKSTYELVTSDYNIVKIDLVINGNAGPYHQEVPGDLYDPLKWIITTGDTGKAMLMLKDTFVPMSLTTMAKGVVRIQVSLKQQPANCTTDLSVSEAEDYIRNLVFSNFGSKSAPFSTMQDIEVCSRHVVQDESGSRLKYKCCKFDDDRNLHCEYVKNSIWLRILFVSIVLIQIGVVLYFPTLLPESIYTERKTFTKYIYDTEPDEYLSLTVKTVNDPDVIADNFQKTGLHSMARLDKFKDRLRTLTPNTVYTLDVDRIEVSARASKILAEGTAPAGIYDFVKRFICQCRMRLEIKSVAECCNENMCRSLPCKMVYYWYQCLQWVMVLTTVFIICIPWIIRVLFYYEYEEASLTVQREAFAKRNLPFPYTGNVVTYVSPMNALFLFVYIFLPVVGILYVFLPSSIKANLKFTVWKCFSHMKNTRRKFACGMFTTYLLWPLTRFGALGCVIFPLWLIVLPFFLILLILEVVPMPNLTYRYIVNFFYYMYKVCCPMPGSSNPGPIRLWLRRQIDNILVIHPDESGHRGQKLFLAIALFVTLLTLWLVILLIGECMSFYVECSIYVLIGFILDPGRAMKFLSVVMLIGVYGYQSFTGVYKTYATYCKSVHQQLQDLLEDKLKEIALLPEDEQENTSFRVPPSSKQSKNEKLKLVSGSEGQLKWNAQRLVLFLNKEDIPYIPKKLLFELANMQHFYCPGQIHMLYLWAMYDFAKILIFLMFVFIVIFAFGQTNNVSSGRQSIAALGSGFLPLMLRKFLFESEAVSKSNLRWYGMFLETLQGFSDRWHPVDIHVSKVHLGVHSHENDEEVKNEDIDEDHVDGKDENGKDKVDDSSEDNDIRNSKETDTGLENHETETQALLPAVVETVDENKKHVNGGIKVRKLSIMPSELQGSETMLTGKYKIPKGDTEVDLIVLFTNDYYGDEVVEFYLQKKPSKKDDVEEIVDDVIEMPYENEEVV